MSDFRASLEQIKAEHAAAEAAKKQESERIEGLAEKGELAAEYDRVNQKLNETKNIAAETLEFIGRIPDDPDSDTKSKLQELIGNIAKEVRALEQTMTLINAQRKETPGTEETAPADTTESEAPRAENFETPPPKTEVVTEVPAETSADPEKESAEALINLVGDKVVAYIKDTVGRESGKAINVDIHLSDLNLNSVQEDSFRELNNGRNQGDAKKLKAVLRERLVEVSKTLKDKAVNTIRLQRGGPELVLWEGSESEDDAEKSEGKVKRSIRERLDSGEKIYVRGDGFKESMGMVEDEGRGGQLFEVSKTSSGQLQMDIKNTFFPTSTSFSPQMYERYFEIPPVVPAGSIKLERPAILEEKDGDFKIVSKGRIVLA